MQRTHEHAIVRKPLQSLSAEIDQLYAENNNYLIEYSKSAGNSIPYCIIYFSSNNIYYPDSKEVFYEQMIKKDRYEWYNTRIDCGTKHIFVRDIKKRHYLTGLNSTLNSIEKTIDFLKAETEGYKIITIGSSSGGYAAVFFGQKLNAERIYCFNGQFLLDVNYHLFREIDKSIVKKYRSLRPFLKTPEKIFYFYSNKSTQDLLQFRHIENTGVQIISFNTSVHGVPFLKRCLPVVLNLNLRDLKILSNQQYDPWFFSIEMVGVWATLMGTFMQLQELVSERSLMRNLKSALSL